MEAFLQKYDIDDLSQLYLYKIKTFGREAKKVKNPMIKKDDKFIMYCEKNTEIILDEKSLEKIRQFEIETENDLVFFKMINGYIATHLRNRKNLYIHQIITGCYGNGKGTKNISVDHIDQNPLNNCFDNLRIADRKTQENNSKGIKEGTKKDRQKTAKPLPEGLTQEMMPKYVIYYKECTNKEKQTYREFFKVEKHPKIQKPICTTKSIKVDIFEKLEEAKKILNEVNNGTYQKVEKKYPIGISIKKFKEQKHFIFDLRTDNGRLNLKMKIKENNPIDEEYNRFLQKLKIKYPNLELKSN